MLVLIINLIYKNRLNAVQSRAVDHVLASEKFQGTMSNRLYRRGVRKAYTFKTRNDFLKNACKVLHLR